MVHACPVPPTGCAFLVCFQLTSSEDENVPESFSLTFGDSSGNSGVNLLFCKNKLLFRESGRYFHGRGVQLQYQKCYCRTVLHLYSGASLRSVAAKIDNYLTTDKLIIYLCGFVQSEGGFVQDAGRGARLAYFFVFLREK